MHPLSRAFAVALLSTVTVACAGGDADTDADTATTLDTAAATTEAAAAAQPANAPVQTSEASITVEDIERWKRGMEGELVAVRQAGESLKAAKTAEDSATAIFEANDMSTRDEGARAAGVDEVRYGAISSHLSALVRDLAPLELEMDVSKMPAEAVAQFKQAREQSLARTSAAFDPAVVEAARARAAELRKQELELTGERLRAAGMAQQQ